MSDFTDEIQQQFDDIADQFDQNATDLQDYTDQNDQNLQDMQTSIDTLNESSGQLTFPLSQDTIDLINQQGFTIMGWLVQQNYIGTATLVGGTVTVSNPNVSATSLVLLSVSTKGGTQGILSYTATAGSLVISSTSGSDTSTVVYFIMS